MPVFNNALAGAAGQSGGAAAYEIQHSLRLNNADNTHLYFDPAGHGNRKVFTFSFWVKRANLGTNQLVLYIRSGAGETGRVVFDSSDRLQVKSEVNGTACDKVTSAKFRDCSAWQHFVVKFDAVNGNCDIYHNGVELTDFDTDTEPTNVDHYFGADFDHYIGGWVNTESLDAYLAEVHMVNGQALAASDFGKFDSNNVWQPIEYTGTYGTNGFYLDFSDNSSDAALGYDAAGSNNWTVNNLKADFSLDNFDFSQGWESSLTFTADSGGFLTGRSPGEVCFDGTRLEDSATNTIGTTAFIDVAGLNLTSSDTLEVLLLTSSPGSLSWSVTGTNLTTTAISTAGNTFVNIPVTGNATGFRVTSTSNTGRAHLAAIKINSKELLSTNVVAGFDRSIDTPTNYTADSGNNGGNYATLNSITPVGRDCTFSNGNLDVAIGSGFGSTNNDGIRAVSTIGMTSGKWYFEHVITGGSVARSNVGVVNNIHNYGYGGNHWVGSGTGDYIVWSFNGEAYNNGSGSSYGDTWTTGDVIGCAFDADSGNLYVYKNGTVMNSGTAAFTGLTDGPYFFIAAERDSNITANFGQRPFAYTPPTGYKALCTQNLDPPTIADGSDYFDVVTYGGNSSSQVIDTSFGADLIWTKATNDTYRNILVDRVRGGSAGLNSDRELAENTSTVIVSNFGDTSYTLGGTSNATNQTSKNYVAWYWDAGTSTDTNNTAGSITPTGVRANASAGFSIVSYTGNGSASATIGHGLNAAPKMIIVKNRDVADDGSVYHVGTDATNPQNYFLKLFAASANGTAGRSDVGAMWNDTAPTSSVFSVGTEDNVNASTEDYIAYCFAPVSQYSAFGSWTGNGSSNGPFVYTGFAPRWVLFKRSDTGGDNWTVFDTARDTNPLNVGIEVNTSGTEQTFGNRQIETKANGFQVTSTGASSNETGATYIYAAIAEHPLKTARAR